MKKIKKRKLSIPDYDCSSSSEDNNDQEDQEEEWKDEEDDGDDDKVRGVRKEEKDERSRGHSSPEEEKDQGGGGKCRKEEDSYEGHGESSGVKRKPEEEEKESKKIAAALASDFFQGKSMPKLSAETLLLFQKCCSFDEVKKIGKQLSSFMDEQIAIVKYTRSIQLLLKEEDKLAWKPEWTMAMNKWLAQISVSSVNTEEGMDDEGHTLETEKIHLMLAPTVRVLIYSDDEGWWVRLEGGEAQYLESRDGYQSLSIFSHIFSTLFFLTTVPFNLWLEKMLALLEIFGVGGIKFARPPEQIDSAILVPRQQLHPSFSKVTTTALTAKDLEENAVGQTWLTVRWPLPVVGGKEADKLMTKVQQEAILHTLLTLGPQRWSKFPELIACLPKEMVMNKFVDRGEGGEEVEYSWKCSYLQFRMLTRDDSCFCEFFITFDGKDFYHERMRRKRFKRVKVTSWPKQKEISCFKNYSPADVICFVKWLMLTTAEVKSALDHDEKFSEKYLAKKTSIGKYGRRLKKVESIILDAFPRDVANIIIDYHRPENRAPTAKQFLKFINDNED